MTKRSRFRCKKCDKDMGIFKARFNVSLRTFEKEDGRNRYIIIIESDRVLTEVEIREK